jgi:SAM-dependent methyltransferase
MLRTGPGGNGALVRADHPWEDAQLASLYDIFPFEGDLPLYRELASAEGGRVLEVACGSGRVLVPLVAAGFDVTGVDISPHMLALARQKLDALGSPRGSAKLVTGDMRTFELPEAGQFDLATLAVKTFVYLTERDDQRRCLQRIAAHLRPGGLLALDLLHPRPEWVGAPNGSLRDDLLQHSDERGVTVSRIESVVSTDLARQIRVIRSMYEIVEDHTGAVTKRFVEWPFRYTYRFEAEYLLERAGFTVEAVYGSYTREPFTSDSRMMLFLARRAAER